MLRGQIDIVDDCAHYAHLYFSIQYSNNMQLVHGSLGNTIFNKQCTLH